MPKRVKNIPIAENTFEAASSFGNYNLALSLADLVDNSISANANEIRIYADFDGINSSLSIIDNGKGVKKTFFKQIFEPGFTSKKRGWGLGLSLVKRIIKDYHKGDVSLLKSTPNQETIIRIVLNK